MKKILVLAPVLALLTYNISMANNSNSSISIQALYSMGVPKNLTTVIDFQFLRMVLGDISEDKERDLPKSSKNPQSAFDNIFREKTIDDLIDNYSTLQVVQFALVDLQTQLSGISYWYIMDTKKYGYEIARIELIRFYTMVRSLELYANNPANKIINPDQNEFIKSVVSKKLKTFENYISNENHFGELDEAEHRNVSYDVSKYIRRLKALSILNKDKKFLSKLDNILKELN